MLSVTDIRTRRPVEVSGVRRGLLVLGVRLRCAGGTAGIDDLRALVVGDVLRRVVESTGPQVVTVVERPGMTDARAAALEHAAAALWIPPPVQAGPDDRVDVLLRADESQPTGPADGPEAPAAVQVAVGPVPGWAPEAALPGADGVDAQAVRLALLRHRHAEPASLTPERLAEAGRTLARWREGVAEWSREPSKPLPGEIRTAAHAALARDLDTPAVLDLLGHVAGEPGIAPGGKFEIFAHLDRFLALELPRDVGTG